jgi:predicted  nucleic acid-binding Zn-ribbon protein
MTEIISIVLLLFLSIIFLVDVILTVRSNRKNKEELVSKVSRQTIDIADLKVTLDNLGEAYNNSVEAVQTELDGFYEAIEDMNIKIKNMESSILFDEKMLDRISEKQGKQIEEIEHRLSSIENSGTK